ncbi:MAG TPA: MFS transporter [Terriglobia bacterium]|nr:MFS transporter [Terriglobia bacterium]
MSAEIPPRKSAPRLPVMFRALGHRNYRLFFSGQMVSLIGTWMQSIAQSWLVYRLTGSSLLLGLVGFAGQIPVFLLAPVGGVFADRHSRHRIVIATQSASMTLAFILAALTLLEQIRVGEIMVLAGLLGVVNAFDIPARQAFIVEMVNGEDLINAIALNSAMFNGARILGPAIAGVTVAAIGEGWCFFSNGVSYLAVIAGLLLMTVPPRQREGRTLSGLESVLEGFRFVWHTGPIRALLLLLGVVSVTGMPYAVLMPIFADKILHGGPRGLGLLMGSTGVGALAATLTLAARRGVRGLGRWVFYASSGFGASLILFSLSRSFLLSLLLLLPAGFCMLLQMSSSNTLIQTMVPDALRGRVMSVYSMMFMGMAPFGSLLAGAVANRLGAPATVALGGTVCIAGSLVFRSKWQGLRADARQLILAQGMSSGEPPEKMTGQIDALGIRKSGTT